VSVNVVGGNPNETAYPAWRNVIVGPGT